MKQKITTLIIAASLAISTPAWAEDRDPFQDWLKQFEELSKEGQSLLEGWIDQLAPEFEKMGPALDELAQKLGDLSLYHPPEVLENGDIILRRKTPLEAAPKTNPDGSIDL